jgi:hypothetical protein
MCIHNYFQPIWLSDCISTKARSQKAVLRRVTGDHNYQRVIVDMRESSTRPDYNHRR